MSEKDQDSQGEELYEHYRFVADPGQTQLRVDKFLLDKLPNTSRNKIQIAAKSGNVIVNEMAVKQNYKVKPGDTISLVLPYPVKEFELIAEDIPLDIVFENESLLVLNKPANMVVHPGHGNQSGTLVNGLIYHFENLPDKDSELNGRPGLVHRLDKNTTGIMVVAKTETALTKLAKQFFDRTTTRKYWALVWGDVKEDGTVTGHLGRSLKNRKLMTVFPEGEYGKHAVTHYRLIQSYGLVSLIECQLETGRTHQIRAHMKHIGHTLFNDPEYGGDHMLKGTKHTKYLQFLKNCFELMPGQALHAKSLGFDDPVTGKRHEFDSELPHGFQELLKKWETYTQY